MAIKKYLLVVALLLTAIQAAGAATFTHEVGAGDTVILNQTTTFSGGWHTPLIFFLITGTIGVLLLLISIMVRPEMPFDMFGYLAPVPLFFSMIMAGFGIDVMTSGGYSVSGTTFTIIENHTIYQPWLLTLFLFVLVGASILNVMRIHNAKAEAMIGTEAPQ